MWLKVSILLTIIGVKLINCDIFCVKKSGFGNFICSDAQNFSREKIQDTCTTKDHYTLTIEATNTTAIDESIFASCSPRDFIMTKGVLQDIAPHSFENFKNLRKINLSQNRIKELFNATFYIAASYTHNELCINVSRNQIDLIHDGAFDNGFRYQKKHIDLSYNLLNDFNMSCSPISEPVHLDLSHNKIKIFKGISNRSFGGSLDLTDNELDQFDVSISSNNRFEYLGLSFNKIRKFLCDPLIPVNAEMVNLTWNRLEYFNLSCFQHNEMTYIDLSHNEIKEILTGVNNPFSIPKLLVNNNLIKSFNISSLAHVQIYHLDLSFNKITEFVWIPNSQIDINRINASHNQLIKFNLSSLGQIDKIDLLDLSFNQIESIVAGYQKPKKIQSFLMNQNRIKIFDVGHVADIILGTLDLSFNNITEIKGDYWNQLNVHEMIFRYNQIGSFNFSCLGNSTVYTLDLSFNRINEIYLDPLYQSKIEYLRLGHNSIKSLSNFEFSSGLFLIDLSYNDLESISSRTFSNLHSLRHLNLSNNHLRDLHFTVFHNLDGLQTLDLSNNHLVAKDLRAVYGLNSLKNLFFHNNQIDSYDFRDLPPNVRQVSFYGNQMKFSCANLQELMRSFHNKVTVIKGPQNYADHVHGIFCTINDEDDGNIYKNGSLTKIDYDQLKEILSNNSKSFLEHFEASQKKLLKILGSSISTSDLRSDSKNGQPNLDGSSKKSEVIEKSNLELKIPKSISIQLALLLIILLGIFLVLIKDQLTRICCEKNLDRRNGQSRKRLVSPALQELIEM